MAVTEVTDPAGGSWTIRRRWTPRWARVDVGRRFRSVRRRRPQYTVGEGREKKRGWLDFIDIPLPDELPVIGIILGAIAVALLVWFLFIPLLLIVLDVVMVILLLVVFAALRVLLRRPWRIEAEGPYDACIERDVVGWRPSKAAIEQLRLEIEAGIAQPDRSTGSSATT